MEIKRSTRERHGDFEVNSGRHAALFTHCDPGASQDRVEETSCRLVIVVEYELTGTVTTTGHRAAAPFIGVLQVRNGQIIGWREYQDAVAIAHALGQLPALLAGASPGD